MSFNDGRRNNGERAEVGESTSEVREERPEPARKSRLLTTASQKKLLQALLAIVSAILNLIPSSFPTFGLISFFDSNSLLFPMPYKGKRSQ
jgi:hypothetical protein